MSLLCDNRPIENEVSIHRALLQPDILTLILSYIDGVKAKVRVERTCKLFRDYGRTRAAWARTNRLWFMDAIENEPARCLLNGDSVTVAALAHILHTILVRIDLRDLRLAFCNNDIVYEIVLACLISSPRPMRLRSLSISGRGRDTILLPFLIAFADTLTCLHVGNCVFSSRMRVEQFWRAIGACRQLRDFRHLTYRSHMDTISLEDDIRRALAGKRLHTLHLLGLRNVSPTGVTELLSSLPVACLRRLSLSHNNVSLKMIRDGTDLEHRESVREFRFGPFPADGADDQLAMDIPHIFPNLTRCTLEAQALTFPSATIVETIDRFLSSRATAGGGNDVTLCMSIYYQHIEVLEKVLGRVVREKACKVTPIKYSHIRDGYIIERDGARVTFYDFELLETEA